MSTMRLTRSQSRLSSRAPSPVQQRPRSKERIASEPPADLSRLRKRRREVEDDDDDEDAGMLPPRASRPKLMQMYISIPVLRAGKRGARRPRIFPPLPANKDGESDASTSTASSSNSSPSQEWPTGRIVEEKRALEDKRKALQQLQAGIEQRERDVKRCEADAAADRAEQQRLLSELCLQKGAKEVEAIFKTLDEHFTCPLCLDIIATPYTLAAYKCGHTFCAICILRWAFALLHECGNWHEPVSCPICRATPCPVEPIIPYSQQGLLTRPQTSCPFIPNRIADAVLESSMERLLALSFSARTIFRGTEEPFTSSSTHVPVKQGKGKKRKREGTEDLVDIETDDLLQWAEQGQKRAEWTERKMVGRSEMNTLVDQWTTFSYQASMAMKGRLGV